MNSPDHTSLDSMISALENLDLAKGAAVQAASAWEDTIVTQIAKGTDPDGKAWKLRQDTGEQPLQNAAKELRVAAVGTSLFARLRGPSARHHRGIARGGLVRAILPLSGIPAAAKKVIRDEITKVFDEQMKHG